MTERPELVRVRRSANAVRRARDNYRAALLAGAEAGQSYGALARAAGVSKQATRQLVERMRGPSGPQSCESDE
jgi:hypothetical protein